VPVPTGESIDIFFQIIDIKEKKKNHSCVNDEIEYLTQRKTSDEINDIELFSLLFNSTFNGKWSST
jgi:hypothetical protein